MCSASSRARDTCMGMDEQVIIVSAYYDGVGTDPLGVIYPGANDNASGVATMLELARLLKTSSYQPDKTVLFVAWTGGERQEGLSMTNILNARPGAADLTVETVIELSGVGYGTGDAISIGNDSSYRLVQLLPGGGQALRRADDDAGARLRTMICRCARCLAAERRRRSRFRGMARMTLRIRPKTHRR